MPRSLLPALTRYSGICSSQSCLWQFWGMEVVCWLGRSFAFPAIASRATQGLWKLEDGFQIKSGMTKR